MLLDDDDAAVRRAAAQAVHHLDDMKPWQVDELIDTFTASLAFGEQFDDLIDTLEGVTMTLPQTTINACECAVEIGGADLADIRTARSLSGKGLNGRHTPPLPAGHADLRARCLDLIERLTDLNAYGVAECLETER